MSLAKQIIDWFDERSDRNAKYNNGAGPNITVSDLSEASRLFDKTDQRIYALEIMCRNRFEGYRPTLEHYAAGATHPIQCQLAYEHAGPHWTAQFDGVAWSEWAGAAS